MSEPVIHFRLRIENNLEGSECIVTSLHSPTLHVVEVMDYHLLWACLAPPNIV